MSKNHFRMRTAHAAFIITGSLCMATVSAEVLQLSEAERLALSTDASVAQFASLVDAAAERAVAAGSLPDPEVILGVQNLPTRTFSMSDDMMTMTMIGVRQSFPPGRTRQLARERGGLEASARHSELRHRELEIQRAVRRAWLDWRLALESLELARAAAAEFEDLLQVIGQRFATGTGRQLEVSRARLERAGFEERILDLELRAQTASATLARWLDRPLDPSAQPGNAPQWSAPDQDRILASLPQHPLLAALGHRVEASEIGTDIARQAYRPMWMAEAGYGIRNNDRSDTVSVMVSMSVPLFTGSRQDRLLAAAQREHDAVRYGHLDQMRVMTGVLNERLAAWQRLSMSLELFRTRLVPDAISVSEDAMSAYGNNRATFDELTRARVAVLEMRLRELAVARKRDDIHVDLLYLAGE